MRMSSMTSTTVSISASCGIGGHDHGAYGWAYLLEQGVKGGELASGAVVLQHAAQHHDTWLADVRTHQLVHHILAEHQPIHHPAVARSAYISHPLHLMQPRGWDRFVRPKPVARKARLGWCTLPTSLDVAVDTPGM